MIKNVSLSIISRYARGKYGISAVCIILTALLFGVLWSGTAAQGAPLAPQAITITKSSVTSIEETNNLLNQAVAGELVTVTVRYNLAAGDIAYSASPRVVLEDGLYPIGSDPAWLAMHTGTRDQLRAAEGSGTHITYSSGGALIIFPDQGTLTGPTQITMTVYAVRTQDRYVAGSEIPHGTVNLKNQGILRYCQDAGCTVPGLFFTPGTNTEGQVNAIRPEFNAICSAEAYLDSAGLGEGGGQARLTFGGYPTNRPAAYNMVFTATLDAQLTYNASNGGVDSPGPGGTTYVVWEVAALPAGIAWKPVITATLPGTFTIGEGFSCPGAAEYDTFPTAVPYIGHYRTEGDGTVYPPGVSVQKTSLPASGGVTMGDIVTYTVTLRQAPNTLLQAPRVVDTQPWGFHYIPGTLTVTGGVTTSVTTMRGPTESNLTYQNLLWQLEDLPLSPTTREVIVTYTAVNTGLDYDGLLTWAATINAIKATNNTIRTNTGAVLAWTAPSGSTYTAAPRVNSTRVDVIQPFMGEFFATSRIDGQSYTREVGQLIRFRLEFRNNGRSPAYDVQVCDQLPAGLILNTSTLGAITYSANFPARSMEPQHGDNLLCWEMPTVPANSTTSYVIEYYAEILNTVMPGTPLANHTYLIDYTSQPGTSPHERRYSEIPIGLPTDKFCADPNTGCLSVLGLTANKTAQQSTVQPGNLVTYTLAYQNTSTLFDYQNVVLTDLFEADLLTFVTATTPPSAQAAGQLVWNVGNLDRQNHTGGLITVTMQVAETVPDGVDELLNTLSWSSAQIPLHTITRTVALQAANLNLTLSGPSNVHAGKLIEYTVVYSNTGSPEPSPVVLTLDYGPYVEYVSASPLPRADTNNIFDNVIPGDGSNHTLTVQARVKAPLPYILAGPLTTQATLTSPGAETKIASIAMILDRPVLLLEKTGPEIAPPAGYSADYVISVRNIGTYTATNVRITDTWGVNLTYRSDTNPAFGWTLAGDGTHAYQALPDLAPGATITKMLQLNIAATAVYYANQVDLTTYQTTQQTDYEETWQTSIATTKTATPVPAFPGRVLTYTVYYSSSAALPLTSVRITDTLPSGFIYQGQSTAQASGCAAWNFTPPAAGGGGVALWECATLTAKASGHFLIWGQVKTTAEGTNLENSTATSAIGISVRPIQEPLVTRVARPWLRIDKTSQPTHPVAPGDLIVYTLTYENYGTDPAYNVVIKDQLPTQVMFVSCTHGCQGTGNNIWWNIAEIPTDTVGSVQVTVQVKPNTGGQIARNSLYTIESQRLPIAETITGDPVELVILAPHLTVEKLATPAFVTQAGDHITYTLTLANDGGGILHNVVITDAISPGTLVDQGVLDIAPGSRCQVSGAPGLNESIHCDLGTLAQGATDTVQFRVYLGGATGQGAGIFNTAYHHSDETATTATNETVVWVTDGCVPPHDVNFTISPAYPRPGQQVEFVASAAGDAPLTYAWTFGDTQTGSGETVQHTYSISGTYAVKLTVSNNCTTLIPVAKTKNVQVFNLPELHWSPTSFTKSANAESTTLIQDTLMVSNQGTANLLWSIEVLNPAQATWLHIAVTSEQSVFLPDQVTAPGGQTPVTLYLDPTGLGAGVYTAQLRILSNDPNQPSILIPVTLTITTGFDIYLPLVIRAS